MSDYWKLLSLLLAAGLALTILLMAFAVLRALFNGTINLRYLLAEPASPAPQADAQAAAQQPAAAQANGAQANAAAGAVPPAPPEIPKASLSRFQLLIFTFVIAGIYAVLCLESGSFVDIPEHVLWLLGVSGGTYGASKLVKTWGDK